MTATTDRRAGGARVLQGSAISLLIAAAAYGLFLGHGLAPMVVGYNLVPSERVLGGEIPYRDFLFNYTPGLLWLNALLFKLFGTTLLVARWGVLAARVATALLLFLIARRYVVGAWGVLAVLMMVAWIGYGDVLKVFPTQYGMAFLLGCLLAVLKAREARGAKAERVWLAVAGSLAGLVFVFKHNVGAFTLMAALASVIAHAAIADEEVKSAERLKHGLMRALPVVIGFALVAGVMFAYLMAHQALAPMLEHFARHAAAYGDEKGVALPHVLFLLPSSLIAVALFGLWRLIVKHAPRAGRWSFGLLAVVLLIILALGERGPTAWVYRSLVAQVYYLPIFSALAAAWMALSTAARSRNRVDVSRHIALASFAIAAFLEIFPRADTDHLVRVLPPALLLALALIGELSRSRSVRGPALAFSLAVIALGVRVTWVPQFGPGLRLLESTPLEFDRGRGVAGERREATRFNRLVAYVQANTAASDPIFCMSRKITSIYFFAARQNTTRLLWYDSAGIAPADREPVYQSISERRFKLIVLGSDLSSDETPENADQRALGLIKENYDLAAVIEEVSLFAPKQ